MAKIAIGAALVVGAAAAFVVAPYLAPVILTNTVLADAVFGIGAAGAGLAFGGIEQALRSNQAIDVSTRQPAQPRQVIYGVSRVAGTIVYMGTSGSNKDYLNTAVVWAGHPCQAIQELYVDSKLVHFADNGGAWGNADGSTYRDDANNQYSFGGLYMEPRLGPNNVYMASLGANKPEWTGDKLINGCCWSYIKYTYSASKYPNGTPNPRATILGKNSIWDPRTNTTSWSNNAALCIADFLCDPIYGFGFSHADLDQAQLVAAANICDEQVPLAAGGTESRYTINGAFDSSAAPGDILASMLDACGGRISTAGGTIKIYPAAWIAPTLAFDESDLVNKVAWSPRRKFRELITSVKGTYVAPNDPYSRPAGNYYGTNGKDQAGNTFSDFQYEWQPTDFPAYIQDSEHGYAVNQPLVNSGGVELWSDMRLQFVTSAATAQRLAKIKLMRNQMQGSGTLAFNLGAYQCQPLDVIQFSFPALQMTHKMLEITTMRFVPSAADDGVSLHIECDVAETDPSVYAWSTSEELTPQGGTSPTLGFAGAVAAPVSPTITDSAATAYVGPDGVAQPRLSVSWTAPADVFVSQIQVQYQLNGWNAWQDAGVVDAGNTATYVSGVVTGQVYNVRLRSVKPSGATSDWAVAGPYTVSRVYSQVNSLGLAPGLVSVAPNNATIDSVLSGGTATIRVYGPGGPGTSYTQQIGSQSMTLPAASFTGQALSTSYSVLWNTATSTYLLTTGTTPSDSYVYVGAVTTVNASGTGGTGGGGGTSPYRYAKTA